MGLVGAPRLLAVMLYGLLWSSSNLHEGIDLLDEFVELGSDNKNSSFQLRAACLHLLRLPIVEGLVS